MSAAFSAALEADDAEALASAVRDGVPDGVDVDAAAPSGTRPLHVAAEGGNLSLLHALLRAGADVHLTNSKGHCALHIACEAGHLPVVSALLRAGADVNCVAAFWFTPLSLASSKGHTAVVSALLRAGADVSRLSVVYVAAAGGHTACLELLLAAGAGVGIVKPFPWSPLMVASHADHAEAVEMLLKAGASVDVGHSRGNETPLYRACANGNLRVARLLFSCGQEPPQMDAECVRTAWTPAGAALRGRHCRLVSELLAAGASWDLAVAGAPAGVVQQYLQWRLQRVRERSAVASALSAVLTTYLAREVAGFL